MGIPSAGARDEAVLLVEGTVSGTTPSAGVGFAGRANLALSGTWIGTVGLDLSFDGGTTWLPVPMFSDGTPLAVAIPCVLPITQAESGVLLRVRPALSAGTCAWRISR